MLGNVRDRIVRYMSGKYGVLWLGLLSFFEAIFLPVPTDSLMMLLLLLRDNIKHWVRYATITMVTSISGAVVGYAIAYLFFYTFGQTIINSFHLERELIQVQSFLNHGTFIFIFIGAVSPIPYKVFVLTAGFLKLNFFIFLLASIIGRSFRLYISAWLVKQYGEQSIVFVKKHTIHISVAALILLVGYAISVFIL